jgi:hypothetical protein
LGVTNDQKTSWDALPEDVRKRLQYEQELLHAESDRGCILVGGALAEEALGKLLRVVCRDVRGRDKGTIADALIGTERPLGTFSARIDACYAFGLVTTNEWKDLHALRELRNGAAHFESHKAKRGFETGFEHPATAERCRKFKIIADWKRRDEFTPREVFVAVVSSLVGRVEGKADAARDDIAGGASRGDALARFSRMTADEEPYLFATLVPRSEWEEKP